MMAESIRVIPDVVSRFQAAVLSLPVYCCSRSRASGPTQARDTSEILSPVCIDVPHARKTQRPIILIKGKEATKGKEAGTFVCAWSQP